MKKKLFRLLALGHSLLLRQWNISEASLLFMFTFLFSAALGIVRQVLFNAQFGTGMQASAFYAAFRLPDTLTSLIAGGTLSNALIPVLAHIHYSEGRQAEQRLANLTFTIILVIVIVITSLAGLFAPFFVRFVLAPGFDAATSALTITLTRIMLLQALLSVISSVIMAVLNSRRQFVLGALAIMCHNVAMITGILAARWIPGLGIYGPTLGVIADAVLQLLILWPGLAANKLHLRPDWNPNDVHLREVGRLLLPNGLSAGINYAGGIIDTAYASMAREAGSLPTLQNASLLMGLPTRLLGNAIGQAAFPRMASYVAAGNYARMRRTLLLTLLSACGLALPVIGALLLWGRQLIHLLFERGQFNADAGTLTYTLLVAYILALPAYVGTDILTRGLIALHDTTTPLFTNIIQLLLRLLIIVILLEHVGVIAIPIAYALSSTLETILLAGFLWLKLAQHG